MTALSKLALRDRTFHRAAILLIGALLAVSLVAAYPQVVELMSGRRPVGTSAGIGLRWLREVVWAVTMALMASWLVLGTPRSGWFWKGTAIATAAIAAYVSFAYARALWLGLPAVVPLTGLRMFQYAPYAWMAYHIARTRPQWLFTSVARILKVLLVTWTPIAVYQVLYAPPVQGMTAFGSRAFATFNEANLFGVTVATSALWISLTHMLERPGSRSRSLWYAFWSLLCLALALLSGSRTALGLTTVAVAVPAVWWMRRRLDRLAVAALVPISLLAILVIGSTSAISGRRTNLLRDGRLDKWSELFGANLDGPADLVFGWGLGLGSNTVNTVFGYGRFEGQFVADSQYVFLLSGFGVLGIAVLFGLLALLVVHGRRGPSVTYAVFVALFCVPFLAFELFPANVLLMLAWGGLLGERRHETTARR